VSGQWTHLDRSMSSDSNIIQIFEHQTLKVGQYPKFKDSHFKELESYGYKTKEKYFSVGNRRIKFSNYVGVIQVRNLTIEILPKADNDPESDGNKRKWRDTLITMLHECKLLKLDSLSNALLKLRSASILDLFFDAFLTETELLFRKGLKKSYREISENARKVKGRIRFEKQLRVNAVHKERVFVEYETYDKNNKLNQILLRALHILSQITANPYFKSRLNKLIFDFEGVAEKNVTADWFDSIHYNRSTERYKHAITLAKLIILKYNPEIRGGNDNVLAILFDMNVLYEEYIYRKLKILAQNQELKIANVRRQYRKSFWDTRSIKPDIIIETGSCNFVIDTKWKILNDTRPSDEDLKQMLVYNLYYDSDLSILLYPKTVIDTAEKKAYSHETLSSKYCQVAFVDLFNVYNKLEKNLGEILYSALLKDEIIR
jgi:5-methylcytosine-specific restriction enzyme subunit McrC